MNEDETDEVSANMETFPTAETRFLLPGPSGELELLATPVRPDIIPKNAVAIICHPHPLFGGTMNNKVVSTLARVFGDLGLSCVRFNFRGVGKSTGQFAEGIGELEDALTVIEWAKMTCQSDAIWLAGFSFGAAIAAFAATKITTTKLVSIAPPVPRFDLLALPAITCPWVIVQGEEDDIVDTKAVTAWVKTRDPLPKLICIPEAGHFFHGKLLELRTVLEITLA